jgi:1,4-dihydroxy-2-naphthoate octaprenyltransferase
VALRKPDNLSWVALLADATGISMHIAANTFNDYFDWKAGTIKSTTATSCPIPEAAARSSWG